MPHFFRIKVFFQISIFGLLCQETPAQYLDWFTDITGKNNGHTVCQFLTLPTSATNIGKGTVSSMGSFDASDAGAYNANTAKITHYAATATHLEWFEGLRLEYLALAYPIVSIGTAGAFARIFTAGDFKYARNADQDVSNPSIIEYAFGASFGRELLYRQRFTGGSFTYLESHLDNAVGRSVAFNADLRYEQPYFSTRFAITNLGPRLTYTATAEPLPAQVSLTAALTPFEHDENLQDATDLPFSCEIEAGVQKTTDLPLLIGAGTDLVFVNTIHVRAGYDYAVGTQPSAEGLSIGAGVQLEKYGIDAAWKNQNEVLGPIWALSAQIRLQEVVPRSADAYYKIAEKHYSDGRYREAIRMAKMALRLDPRMWKAHSLINQAQIILRRENGTEIGLIYTGNLQGEYLPFDDKNGSSGGLARITTGIRDIERHYGLSASILAGNCLNRTTDSYRARILQKWIDKMNFSAVVMGANEFASYSEGKILPSAPLLATLPDYVGSMRCMREQTIHLDKYRLFVVSTPGLNLSIDALADALNNRLISRNATDASMRIVVTHEPLNVVQALARKIYNTNIIICGGVAEPFESLLKVDSTYIASAGNAGRAIGTLSLLFSDRGKLLRVENRLTPINNFVPEDLEIRSMVDDLLARSQTEQAGLDDSSAIWKGDGYFPFVSKRTGVPQIYMKIIDKNAEFPLTYASQGALSPQYSNGMITYRQITRGDYGAWIMNTDGTSKRCLIDSPAVTELRLNAAAEWLYTITGDSLMFSNTITRIHVNGTPREKLPLGDSTAIKELFFSSDNTYLGYSLQRPADRDWQIWYTSLSGEKPVRVSNPSSCSESGKFSPDNVYIAWLSDLTNARKNMDLWIYNSTTAQVTQLTRQAYISEYTWLDGTTLIYAAPKSRPRLMSFSLNTGETHTLTDTTAQTTWREESPSVVAYHGLPKVMYERVYNSDSSEIWWMNPDGSMPQRIIDNGILSSLP